MNTLQNDPRSMLMLQLMQNMNRPIQPGQGMWQGLNALAQGAMMGRLADKADARDKTASDERAQAMQSVLGKPAESEATSAGTINWNPQAPNLPLAASQLGPDNQDMQKSIMQEGFKERLQKQLLEAKALGGQDDPSSVREYNYYKKLTPEEQRNFLEVKRNTQYLNLGDRFIAPSTGDIQAKGLPPQEAPELKGQQTAAQEAAKLNYAGPMAQAEATGKQAVENTSVAQSSKDIIGLYGQLKEDAKEAPSGAIASKVARMSNAAGMPTKGAVAQGKFDADLNNLYLATIRSLKGTGRVMEQELIKIGEAAPRPEDSTEVKIAKTEAHMKYYKQRMKELGFDPDAEQPAGDQGGIPDDILRGVQTTPAGRQMPLMPPPAPGIQLPAPQPPKGAAADPLGIR